MKDPIYYTVTRLGLTWGGFCILFPDQDNHQFLDSDWHVFKWRCKKEIESRYPGAILITQEEMDWKRAQRELNTMKEQA